MKAEDVKIIVADESHIGYVDTILSTIEAAAKVRGTGIAKRDPEYVNRADAIAATAKKARLTFFHRNQKTFFVHICQRQNFFRQRVNHDCRNQTLLIIFQFFHFSFFFKDTQVQFHISFFLL